MIMLLVLLFSQERFIIDIWQGYKYGSAASFFNIFPLLLYMKVVCIRQKARTFLRMHF